jgi:hypothetical protein
MKRVGIWAIGIGVLLSMGLLTVKHGYADENDRATKCTTATLKWRYLFAGTGTLLPPAVEEPTLLSVAGYHIFNGDGTGHDFVTGDRNGINLDRLSSPVTYTLNSDCTGTYTVVGGPNFDIFVSPNGDQLAVIGTDPGVVLAEGPNTRVAPK